MGKTTAIAWCDSTWNPWIGCTKVSPGCDHCYAEALDALYRWGGSKHWGPGVPRHRTSAHYWKQPHIWNKVARDHGKVHRVFPSLCDPFDNEVSPDWRGDFWQLVLDTPYLTWLILTKRIGNANSMLPPWHYTGCNENVWIGASIVNQQEADRDIPRLMATPAAKRFISYEPALGPVDFEAFLWRPMALNEIPGWAMNDGCSTGITRRGMIHQIIIGGESDQGGHKARAFDLEWARATIRQCRAAGVAVFVKQIGSNPKQEGFTGYPKMKGRGGADPVDWPADVRVQESPK